MHHTLRAMAPEIFSEHNLDTDYMLLYAVKEH